MKRALSLFLVAIMIITMIPLGALSVFADGQDGNLKVDTANDPEGTVYTVYGPLDWATIRAASNAGDNFKGDTIELGANFGGTEETPLELTALTVDTASFAGNFNGNGNTISYVNVVQTPGKRGVLFFMTTAGGNTIENVTLSHVNLSLEAGSGECGLLVGRVNGVVTERNITIENCEINITNANNRAGLLNGYINNSTGTNLTVDGMTVRNSGLVSTATTSIDVGCGLVAGQHDNNGNTGVTVRNTNFENCYIDGSNFKKQGTIIGWQNFVNNVLIENVNIDVDITPMVGLDGERGIGGVVGFVDTYSQATTVRFTNVNVTGSINLTNAQTNVGGLYGKFGGNSSNPTNLAIDNCYVDLDINVENYGTDNKVGAGMLTGSFQTYNAVNNYSYAGTLTVNDSVFAGSITKTGEGSGNVGVALGQDPENSMPGKTTASVVFDNCVFATEITGAASAVVGAALKVDTGAVAANPSAIVINNCVTTIDGLKAVGYASLAESFKVNGADVPVEGYADDSVLKVDDYSAMVTYDEDGFIDEVSGHINGGYAQVAAGDGSYAIRFIALSQIAAPANAKMDIVVKVGDVAVRTFAASGCEAYDKLSAYNAESGAVLEEYTATDFGAEKFLAVVIKDVPMDGVTAYTFEVTVSYTTAGGVVISDTTVCNVTAAGAIA